MEMMPEFSSARIAVLINDTLRLYVGHGRRISWADLAAATGDNERKLRSYVEPDGPDMPLPVFMRVFIALPPEALARVARHMGFAAAPLDVDDDATVRSAIAGSARLVAQATEAMEDGTLDHRERAKLAQTAAGLVPQLQAIAGGKA